MKKIIKLSDVELSPMQLASRQETYSPEKYDKLVEIYKQGKPVRPIKIRQVGSKFYCVCGHMWLKAMLEAGIDEITLPDPRVVVVEDLNEKDADLETFELVIIITETKLGYKSAGDIMRITGEAGNWERFLEAIRRHGFEVTDTLSWLKGPSDKLEPRVEQSEEAEKTTAPAEDGSAIKPVTSIAGFAQETETCQDVADPETYTTSESASRYIRMLEELDDDLWDLACHLDKLGRDEEYEKLAIDLYYATGEFVGTVTELYGSFPSGSG